MKSPSFEAKSESLGIESKENFAKSKLEQYLAILNLLSSNGPMYIWIILQHTKFNSVINLRNFRYLIELNLVDVSPGKYGWVYSITIRGEKAVSYFRTPVYFAF
jgi:hypothetical protein